jgi:hypothetical protein
VRAISNAIEVFGKAVGFRPEGAALQEPRTRASLCPGVRRAVHCQAVGHAWRCEGAVCPRRGCAFARRGVELRESGAAEHKLCMKGAAAEYAQLVWPRVMQAVCTAVQYVPASSRSVARLRKAHRAATGIACRRQGTVRPNTSFKRTHNGMAPGPRGRLAYHRPRGPGSTPLRAA